MILFGFEFKYADKPQITKSMRIALVDLQLDHLMLVYPGKEAFPLADKITAYGLDGLESADGLKNIF
jgi:hypothetical protein